MSNPVSTIAHGSAAMTRTVAGHARLLVAITRVELEKKYAGSVLGLAWLFLQPALLLAVYLFVYMVVFKFRFEGFSTLDYVLFVFAGLVPFIGGNEAINASAMSIKQNMHLVKNVMLPIELIPVRTVFVSLAGQVIGLTLVLALSAVGGALGPMALALPIAVLLQALALLGLAWIVSGLGVVLPDVAYFINLFLFLLMFISPIAFKPDMVPATLRLVVYANPIYYMLEVYRDCLIAGRTPDPRVWAIDAAISVGLFVIGGGFFRTFKNALVDYE
jgi:homopolymeric O-antigen transport system permease protein